MEQKVNKSRNWNGIILLAIIILPIIIVGFSGGDKRNYSQKDIITYEGAEYSIKKVEKDDKYITVTINIKNKSNKTLSYSEMHFIMLNQKGEQVDYEKLVFDDGTLLTSGKLEPNEETEGTISWLQDKRHKSLKIRYYENFLMFKIDDYKFEWSLDD